MEVDIKKVIGETPENVFDAIKLMNKAQQELLDAINIMDSIIENPNELEFHFNKIKEFLNKFEKQKS